MTDSGTENIARSEGVRTAELPVGDQIPFVSTHRMRFFKDRARLAGTHRKRNHFCTDCIFELKSHLECMAIVRVHDARYAFSNERIFHWIDLDLRRIGHLFQTNCDSHGSFFIR